MGWRSTTQGALLRSDPGLWSVTASRYDETKQTAGTLNSKSVIEGIATNGTDVWIVDAKTDKVYRYANGATAPSGTLTAASSFSLNASNLSPKDIVTDGTYLWVVNDSTTDAVFKYSMTGAYQGSWTINGGGGSPTGITLDPSNASQDLWIVDANSDRLYRYADGRGIASGTQTPTNTFALAAGNTNPQGIADPPVPRATPFDPSMVACLDAAAANVLLAWESGRVTLITPGSGAEVRDIVPHRVLTATHRVDEVISQWDMAPATGRSMANLARATNAAARRTPHCAELDQLGKEFDTAVSKIADDWAAASR